MSTKILFLTTHNLATNPRLVKEIRLALKNGFLLELICFEFDNWSKDLNTLLKNEFAGVKIISIPAGRKPFIPWILSGAAEWFYRKRTSSLSANNKYLSKAISRRSQLLINALNKVSKPDLVIGHNPGALYPAFYAAQKFLCRVGFDVEDYHPGEGDDRHLQNLSKKLMQDLLKKMDYVSFASPLIRDEVRKDLGSEGNNWITVLNYFPASEFVAPAPTDGPVKLVWFSQNIAAGRGLELILPTLIILGDKVELHLFGQVNQHFYETNLKGINNIIIHDPIPQKELYKKLREFDIGLALEPAKDKNNELAISNKLLAYMQAGLYVLATDTPAQKAFLNDYSSHGGTFQISGEAAELRLTALVNRIESIRADRKERFQNFKNNHWERASGDLLETWKSLN